MIEPITTARPQSLLMRRQGASEGGALAAPAATAAPAPSAAQPARTAQAAATTQSAMQPARAAQAATTALAATTAHAAQPPRVSGGVADGRKLNKCGGRKLHTLPFLESVSLTQ
jgi:hypothetical protein